MVILDDQEINFETTNWRIAIDDDADEAHIEHKETGNALQFDAEGNLTIPSGAEISSADIQELTATLAETLDADGNDIKNIGKATAGALEAEDANIRNVGASFEKNSTQDIQNNTSTTLEWDEVLFDDIGEFDNDENEWSPDEDGQFTIIVRLRIESITESSQGLILIRGGATRNQYGSIVSHNSETGMMAVFPNVNLSSSNSIRIDFRHKTGDTETIIDGPSRSTAWEIIKTGGSR